MRACIDRNIVNRTINLVFLRRTKQGQRGSCRPCYFAFRSTLTRISSHFFLTTKFSNPVSLEKEILVSRVILWLRYFYPHDIPRILTFKNAAKSVNIICGYGCHVSNENQQKKVLVTGKSCCTNKKIDYREIYRNNLP